jgi:hypothetical protein
MKFNGNFTNFNNFVYIFKFPGHLTFQCRNYLPMDPNRKPIHANNEDTEEESEEEEFMSPVS